MEVTAVEYLFEQINDALIDFTEGKISALIYGIRVTEYKQQAKEMEKQQIIDAWQRGFDWGQSLAEQGHETTLIDAKHYYNETYGKAN